VLAGLRVLEIGHFIAAPFCTRLLADLGADVIKIEPLSGDPVRQWGAMLEGRSLWWSMHGRNKRSLALDLKHARARQIVLRLAARCDVVVENLRPGHLAKLGLGADSLRAGNPTLVMAHISGYGQTGPNRDRAAFGLIGEAIGGLRHLTNHPPGLTDLQPVRVGLYAAFGIMSALWQRDRSEGDRVGRTVDVALTESVLSLMEGMLPEYGALGKIKQPTGGAIATAAPTNAYPTKDGVWVLIGANSDPLFAKLAGLMQRPDLPRLPAYRGNRERVENVAVLDALIADWTQQLDSETLLDRLDEADIPNCRAFNAADCAADAQYRHRKMVREVPDPHFGRDILQAGIVPHVPESPGQIRWPGPDVGEHTDEILAGLLGMSALEISELRAELVLR
jgi:crotonobetainyl-CoA:carnitine CoA-transferase CaiB-like acyl-CoA transferase